MQGSADCGFQGNVYLQPPGVSYQALEIREGEFKGKGSGYYQSQNDLNHAATAPPRTIINGNQLDNVDTIYSGIQGTPYTVGRFDWHIPWQYRLAGANDWTTFEYANHVQEITALGAVSIGKFNAGPFTRKVSDVTQPF